MSKGKPESNRLRQERYREKHREQLRVAGARYRAENADAVKAQKKRWQLDNRDAVRLQKRATESNRRAREAGVVGFIRAEDVISRKATCYYCGKVGDSVMDHVVPLSRGGENVPENIVPACRSCNASKRDKLLSEWSGSCSQKSA